MDLYQFLYNVVRSFEMEPKNLVPNSQRLCPSYSYNLSRYDQIVTSLIVLLLLTTKWKLENKFQLVTFMYYPLVVYLRNENWFTATGLVAYREPIQLWSS